MLPKLSSALAALGLLSLVAQPVLSVNITANAAAMFDKEMTFLDSIYDRDAGYLYWFYYPLAAGAHETRSSIWYALGLLQRNSNDDVEQAAKIITNVIDGQEKVVEKQWYGDYTVYPEQPTVGTAAYPKSIYNSWDPNWRGFIGVTLVVIYEEYGDLLTTCVKDLILESLYNNTVGDSYRVGGVDDDNLYPSYSNPWLMRAVVTGWTGRKLNESNMTVAGELYAQQALDLWNVNETLPEFNTPTYTGVSLYALTMWAKYLPSSSLMGQYGASMVTEVWDTFASLYNTNLRNLAGPWDRNYGYDMTKYVGIMSLYVGSLVGFDKVFRSEPMWLLAHADDGEMMPLIAALSEFHATLVSNETIAQLTSFPGEHTVHRQAYAPPHDLDVRNISSWLSANLTIGIESFNQTTLGGAREDVTAWAPAIAQWGPRSDGSVGYFVLRGTEVAMQGSVAANEMNLTWPAGNASSVFTFLVSSSTLAGPRDLTALSDIEGVNITLLEGSTVLPEPEINFCGLVGGNCSIIHDFEFWNFTFTLPANSTEVPSINLRFDLP